MHEQFIIQTVESVLMQQTNFDVELIIADDNSQDETEEKVEKIIKNHPNGHWIKYTKHTTNKGMQPNFIWAFEQCRGKYIALLEGDDYWTDRLKLQKQVDFMTKNPNYSGCFHFTQQITEIGSLGKIYGRSKKTLDYTTVDTFSETAIFHTSSFFFRREAFTLQNWFSKVVSGDMALFSIVSAKGKLRCIPEVMSIYRKNDGGITNTEAVINNYHINRIELIHILNEFHQFKYDKKAQSIIRFHQRALSGESEEIKNVWRRIKQKLTSLLRR